MFCSKKKKKKKKKKVTQHTQKHNPKTNVCRFHIFDFLSHEKFGVKFCSVLALVPVVIGDFSR